MIEKIKYLGEKIVVFLKKFIYCIKIIVLTIFYAFKGIYTSVIIFFTPERVKRITKIYRFLDEWMDQILAACYVLLWLWYCLYVYLEIKEIEGGHWIIGLALFLWASNASYQAYRMWKEKDL